MLYVTTTDCPSCMALPTARPDAEVCATAGCVRATVNCEVSAVATVNVPAALRNEKLMSVIPVKETTAPTLNLMLVPSVLAQVTTRVVPVSSSAVMATSDCKVWSPYAWYGPAPVGPATIL